MTTSTRRRPQFHPLTVAKVEKLTDDAVAVTFDIPDELVEAAFVPLQVATGSGQGAVPGDGRHLTVTGAEVSALHREADALVLRVFNPTDEPTTVTVDGRQGWLVDLRGRPVAPFEQTVDLAPHRIATLHLTE